MRNLTPIKVKILQNQDGSASYPDFNQLNCVNINWTKYVDTEGLGWHYDKTSGLRDNAAHSPIGQQFGVLIIPKEFADEAVVMFPNICSKITETELEDFYNNKAHINDPEEKFDQVILDGIKAKQDLGIDLTESQLKAIDPNDPTPGIVKNNNKYWSDFKVKMDVNIVQ